MWWRRSSESLQKIESDALVATEPAARISDDELVYLQSTLDGRMTAQELVVPWSVRAQEIGARMISMGKGVAMLQAAWSYQGPNQVFSREDLMAIGSFFEYYALGPKHLVVHQNEYGDYMLIQLTGVIAVERAQAGRPPARMAQTNIGDVLGEMSLLDQGLRFSSCITLTPCDVAVLTRDGLDRMLHEQPHLAAKILQSLARKLSIRLRSISARMD